jgi:hypothetical protein
MDGYTRYLFEFGELVQQLLSDWTKLLFILLPRRDLARYGTYLRSIRYEFIHSSIGSIWCIVVVMIS